MKISYRQINYFLLLLLNLVVALSAQFSSLLEISFPLICFLLVLLFFSDELFKLAPLFLFFNSSILYINGFSIVNLFFLVYILKSISKKISISRQTLPITFLIFILYTIFVIGVNDFSLSIEILVSFIFLIFLLNDLRNSCKWDGFCIWYVISMLAAIIYGGIKFFLSDLVSGNRLMLAFTDPNYAGMFLSIGLYILVLKKHIFNPLLRWIFILITVCSIFLTISSTALLCNIVILLILFFDFKRIIKLSRYSILKNIFLYLSFVVLIYILIQSNSEFSRIFDRFIGKINFIENSGLSQATTGRSDIWLEHLNFFFSQDNALNFLFGGNYLTDRGFDISKFSIVSHQVYIDSLITFGFIGTLIYVIDILKQLKNKLLNRDKTENNRLLFTIVLIWIIYSFGLSMFPFWGFILLLFVSVREEDLSENKKFN